MKTRKSTVTWKGSGKEGSGTISTQSRALNEASYSWRSRFEETPGTNPEELLGAAHAACFTLKLAFLLNAAGYKVETLETVAVVTLEKDSLSHSNLSVKGDVPDISEEKFLELAKDAGKNCIVSRAINLKTTVDAQLSQEHQV